MKTEIKKVTISNVGSPELYTQKRQTLHRIKAITNSESMSAEETKKYFETVFNHVDPLFYEAFDMEVGCFPKVELQEYYFSDWLMECHNLYPSVFSYGIKLDEFIEFTKKHGIYFEFTFSHLYCYLKSEFWSLSDWGGHTGLLATPSLFAKIIKTAKFTTYP